MRLLVDASCPRLLVTCLRELGHEVDYAVDIASSASDRYWAERATRLAQVIVTQDYDFGELAQAGLAPCGVVQIAPSRGRLEERVSRVVAVITEEANVLTGAITTVEAQRVPRRQILSIG